MAQSCSVVVPQLGLYYQACLYDIAATQDVTIVDRHVAAVAVQCDTNNNHNSGVSFPILASYTKASGPGVTAVVANIPATFTLVTYDALDHQKYDSSISFSITVGGVHTLYYDNLDGTYTVPYTATSAGTITVSVSITTFYGQLPIKGSPFTVNVLDHATCISWGDPHFTSYTGIQFSFQGYGEYVLAEANGATIQVRQEPCNPGVYCNYAVVASNGVDTVGLYSVNNKLSAVANNQNVTIPYSHNSASVMQVNGYEYDIVFNQVFTIKAQFYGRLDLTVVVPTTVPGFSLLGGLCGTTATGYVFSNGSSFAGSSYNQNFIELFGESWKVQPAQTTFTYNVTNSTYTAQNPANYTANTTVNLQDPVLPVAQENCAGITDGGNLAEACRTFVDFLPYYTACIFDVVATHDSSLAASSIVAYSTICSQYLNPSSGAYPTVAGHCFANGTGLSPKGLQAHTTTSFTVYLIDALGQPQLHATDNVTVVLTSSPTGNLNEFTFSVPPAQLGTSQYNVTYYPTRAGQYTFEILVNGQPILNSPFPVFISPAPTSPATSTMYGPGIQSAPVNAETWIIIVSRTADGSAQETGGDVYSVTISPSISPISVTDNNDGTYLVIYTPITPGSYQISVTLNNTALVHTPVSVTISALKQTVSCISWGDPHFTTFTGRVFDFQGYGEYTLAKIANLEIQVRQAPCNPGVTCNYAIVGKENNTTLGIYLIGSAPAFYKNGIVTVPTNSVVPLSISSGPPVYQYVMNFVAASVQVRVYSTRLDLTIYTASNASYPIQPLTGGLCGVWDMFYSQPNGTHIYGPAPGSFAGPYGDSWRVTNTTSLFNYGYTNSSYAAANPTNFIEQYDPTTSDPTLQADANDVCSVITNGTMAIICNPLVPPYPFYAACMYDIISLNNTSAGQASIVSYSTLCQDVGRGNNNSEITIFPVIAEHTYASGPGVDSYNLTEILQTWFIVYAIDALGNPSNTSEFIITAVGPTDLIFTQTVVTLGVINVTYSPATNGSYTISVGVGSAAGTVLQISGSPFKVFVNAIPCKTDANCPYGSFCNQTSQICQLDLCGTLKETACGSGYTCSNYASTYLCTDINECLNPKQCPSGDLCVNLQGSYYCKDLTCSPLANCNNKGVCVNGTCICQPTYTGPGCEGPSIPITIIPDPNVPSVTVIPQNYPEQFVISIKALRELDTESNVIREVPLTQALNFTLQSDNQTWLYTMPRNLVAGISGSSLTVKFAYYQAIHNVSFANQNETLPPFALKLSATINDWPFVTVHSRLAFIIDSYVSQNGSPCYAPSVTVDDNNNRQLLWVKNANFSVTLYGSYLQDGYADGNVVELSNLFNHSSNETSIILPHFYNYGTLDPDFSVLIDPFAPSNTNVCTHKKKKNITTPIVATIFSVLGVAAIAAAVLYLQRRRMREATRRKLTAAGSRNALVNSRSNTLSTSTSL